MARSKRFMGARRESFRGNLTLNPKMMEERKPALILTFSTVEQRILCGLSENNWRSWCLWLRFFIPIFCHQQNDAWRRIAGGHGES